MIDRSSADLFEVAANLREAATGLVKVWKGWGFTRVETESLANIVADCMLSSAALSEMAQVTDEERE